MEEIKLTQYSHGAGCGCKISPELLETILHKVQQETSDPMLLVGNATKDDAAVYDLGNGQAIISTTDFFMPIVDNPEDFGGIASVNAISDVYAMGGKPLMAIAILGWPIDKLGPEVAQRVLEGSRAACRKANIQLAGGHSIDSPEPIFGLAVTGIVNKENLKQNDKAKAGSALFLTKKLGIGLVTTAQKRALAKEEDLALARESMLTLNSLGYAFGELPYVNALTDVTGFGLLGHLVEICEGSSLSAEIYFDKVPVFPFAAHYVQLKAIPGGTLRNWKSYGHKVNPISDFQRAILADPQTSGGLLVAVDQGAEGQFMDFGKKNGLELLSLGRLKEKSHFTIEVFD